MVARNAKNLFICAIATGLVVGVPSPRCLADSQTCVSNALPGVQPTHQVCVWWSQGVPPEEDVDFSVDYGPEYGDRWMAPDVEFITGEADPEAGCDAGWLVWARLNPPLCTVPCPPLDLGAVSVDPTAADDFDITIAQEGYCHDGAHNVGSIILVPAGDHYSSVNYQSIITNDLTGPLTVKQDSAGNGGDLHVLIEGDVSGPITAATITDLEIRGNLTAPIEAVTITSLRVRGSVSADVNAEGVIAWMDVDQDVKGSITAADITSLNIDGNLSGDVNIGGDMTSGAGITVVGQLASEGRIRIDGLCDAPITIGEGTGANTLIRATDGLGANGSITINNIEGNFNADGEILIGDLATVPPPPVTFDDCAFIVVNDNGSGSYGNLNDWLRVVGCHTSGHNLLDLCVGGDAGRWISIIETGCAYPGVGHVCDGGSCP